MNRHTWSDLSIFAAIADAGSFTAAAKKLGVSASALSHSMRAMEERLGVRLLNRSTRSSAPTEAGERLLARLRPAMSDLEDVVLRLEECRDRPAGRVRISAHRTGAMLAIAPKLPAFAKKYPDVQVELAVEDGLVDIVAQGFDAGVRHEQVLENDMISVRISNAYKIVYVATPDYWRHATRPKTPHDLLAHRCTAYRLTSAGGVHRWRFIKGDHSVTIDPPAILISNDVDVVLRAAVSGMGVACLLESQVHPELEAGTLVPVLRDWSPRVAPNYLYYSGRRQMTPALRAFVEFMRLATSS
jgi:DNA-binding transcriptional LysR family regulator